MKICIFGGTFNPIHNGHLIMAQIAMEKFSLDRVIFIPCYLPPHKGSSDVADPRGRLQMVKRAVKGNKSFSVSDMEIKRGGRSYSIDTMKILKAKAGREDKFYFLIGSDSLRDFNSWYDSEGLLKICSFIVVERPDIPVKNILKKFGPKRKYFTRVVSEFPVGISSTEIRKMVRAGKPIKYLVPDSIERYILKNRLYKR